MPWKKILWIGAATLLGLIIALYILLSTYDYNSLKPQIERAVKDETGRELVLGGQINLRLGLSPALVVENLVFKNAPWGSRPDMMSLKRLEIRVALLPLIVGHADIKRFVLIEPDILIETDRSGRSNLAFKTEKEREKKTGGKGPPAEAKLRLPALTVAEVKIERGHVTYRDGKSDRVYAFAIDTMEADASGAESPVRLKMEATWKSKAFKIDGTIGSWSALTSGSTFPVHVVTTAAQIRFAVDGSIKDVLALRGMDVRMEAKGEDMAAFSSLSGEPVPLKGPFDISARLTDPAPGKYRVSELRMVLGDSDLSGSAEVDLSGYRPAVRAALLSKKLDLRPFLTGGSARGGEIEEMRGRSERGDKVFSDRPFPIQALDEADGTIKLQADKVLLPRVAIDAFKGEMELKGRHLLVKPFAAMVGEGPVNGSLDLDPQGSSAKVRMELEARQVDVGHMMQELGKGEPVQGHLDISMDVHSKGRSEAELMSGLDGRVVMTMKDGRIHNSYIELLGGDLSSGIFRLLNPFQKGTEYTDLHCLVSGFNLHDGMAETTAFVADTTEMSVIAEGEVNLKTEALDFSLKPVPKEGIGTGVTGKVSLSLSELARPFKLGGTLSHPSLGIDTALAAETLAKAAGGMVLFGPAGLAAMLLQGGSGEGNLCRVATEAAEKGVPLSAVEKQKGVLGRTEEGLEEGLGAVGKKLRGLFGN